MPYCTSCGSTIPTGQGKSCSMCYGDVGYGRDGYYKEWLRKQWEYEMLAEQEARLIESAMLEEK